MRWLFDCLLCLSHPFLVLNPFSCSADRNYYQCWLGLKSHFDPTWTPEKAAAAAAGGKAAAGGGGEAGQQAAAQQNGAAAPAAAATVAAS